MKKQNHLYGLSSGRSLRFIYGIAMICCLVGLCVPIKLWGADKSSTNSLTPALKVAKRSLDAATKVKGFTGNFTKQERVDGRLQPKVYMGIKWRAKPFSVYLKFIQPHQGREVLYVAGKNNGNLLVHETGLVGAFGTLKFSPASDRVMAETRYPITNSGFVKMAEAVITQWENEKKYNDVNVKYYKDAKLKGRACRVIETSHATKRKGFPFYMTRLYIDAKTILPVRVEQYGYPSRSGGKPPIMEEYEYSNINTDVNLTDIDFSTRNRNYGF